MIEFKKIEENDFEMLYKWLNKDHVSKYFSHNTDSSFEEVCKKYRTRMLEEKMSMNLIIYNNLEIGYIQSYDCDYLDSFDLSESAIAVDLYIGEESYIHKGYGTKVLKEYIMSILSKQSHNWVVIDPDEDNIAAIKSYTKVGFRHVKTSLCPGCGKHNNYYMVLSRQDFFGKN